MQVDNIRIFLPQSADNPSGYKIGAIALLVKYGSNRNMDPKRDAISYLFASNIRVHLPPSDDGKRFIAHFICFSLNIAHKLTCACITDGIDLNQFFQFLSPLLLFFVSAYFLQQIFQKCLFLRKKFQELIPLQVLQLLL